MGKPDSLATLAAKGKKSVEIAAAHFRITSTTKVLAFLCAIGIGLLTLGIILDAKGVHVPGSGLRWLYLFGAVLTGMILLSSLVDIIFTWLELRYFLRLVMLPSSQVMFKVWVILVAAFVCFSEVFQQYTVGGVPPQPLNRAEDWVRRLLLCGVLFTSVCVAVTAVSNLVVALLYSENSRQKIVAAMQHEYVMYRLIKDKLRDEYDGGAQAATGEDDGRHSNGAGGRGGGTGGCGGAGAHPGGAVADGGNPPAQAPPTAHGHPSQLHPHAHPMPHAHSHHHALHRLGAKVLHHDLHIPHHPPPPPSAFWRRQRLRRRRSLGLSQMSSGLQQGPAGEGHAALKPGDRSVGLIAASQPDPDQSPMAGTHAPGGGQQVRQPAVGAPAGVPYDGGSGDRVARQALLGGVVRQARGTGDGNGAPERARRRRRVSWQAEGEGGDADSVAAGSPRSGAAARDTDRGTTTATGGLLARLGALMAGRSAAQQGDVARPPDTVVMLELNGKQAERMEAAAAVPAPLVGVRTGRSSGASDAAASTRNGEAAAAGAAGRRTTSLDSLRGGQPSCKDRSGSHGRGKGSGGGGAGAGAGSELRNERASAGGVGAGVSSCLSAVVVDPDSASATTASDSEGLDLDLSPRFDSDLSALESEGDEGGGDDCKTRRAGSGGGDGGGGWLMWWRRRGRRRSKDFRRLRRSGLPEGAVRAQSLSYSSLHQAIRRIQDIEMVHVRRTLLASLEVYDWLRERSQQATGSGRPVRSASAIRRGGGGSSGGGAPVGRASMVRRELYRLRRSGARHLINPRVLLDDLLQIYGGLSDSDIPLLARHFAEAVWECAAPDGESLRPEDFLHIFPREGDRAIAWDALDGDKDGLLTLADVTAAVVTFLQQERSMALTVRAVRRLTLSLQFSLIGIINGIFLMVVYLSILDVTHFFNGSSGSKTALDIFAVYVVVVSLIFSEAIRNVLSGCILILSQQPFDVGEELVIEESPGWRVMGIVQDFNVLYLRVKKSTDGELVTLPLSRLTTGRFTNLSRSDWKIEQNFFAVDVSTPPEVLTAITTAALAVIRATPGEYDIQYGFLATFHGFERPNKVVIRTFHRYKFNLSAAHKRIALGRHGIMTAVRQTLDKYGVEFTELRMHASFPVGGMPYPLGGTAAADAAAAVAAAAAAAAAGYGAVVPGAPGAATPAAL